MTVYAIFHCDAWKSYASMRFIGVASESGLRRTLGAIKKECGYSDEDLDTYIYIKETTLDDISEMNI